MRGCRRAGRGGATGLLSLADFIAGAPIRLPRYVNDGASRARATNVTQGVYQSSRRAVSRYFAAAKGTGFVPMAHFDASAGASRYPISTGLPDRGRRVRLLHRRTGSLGTAASSIRATSHLTGERFRFVLLGNELQFCLGSSLLLPCATLSLDRLEAPFGQAERFAARDRRRLGP